MLYIFTMLLPIDIEKINLHWKNSVQDWGIQGNGKALEDLSLHLDKDERGRTYFFVTDGKNTVPFSDVMLSTTELGRKIAVAKKNTDFLWNADDAIKDSIYIDEHEELCESLFSQEKPLIFKKSTILTPAKDELGIVLLVSKRENIFSLNILDISDINDTDIEDSSAIIPLSSNFCAKDGSIFRCIELGINYNYLPSFEGAVQEEELNRVLTLFTSLFPKIQIYYNKEPCASIASKNAERALRFKSLDEEGNLCVELLWMEEDFKDDFITENMPPAIIKLNKDKNALEKYQLRYDTTSSGSKNFETLLRNCAKKHSDALGTEFEPYTMEGNNIFISNLLALHFLTENLGLLTKNYKLFGTEDLRKYKLRYVRPKANLNISSGIDYFDTHCTIDIGEQTFAAEDAISLFEKNNYIPLNDGSRAIIDMNFFARLKRLLGKKEKNGNYKISFFDLPLIQELIDVKTGEGGGLEQCREFYEGLNSINDRELLATPLTEQLRDYQKYGVKWLSYLSSHNVGGCLADDMGLGKTIQSIALLADAYKKEKTLRSSLVVVPKSLIANWQEELSRFASDLDVYTYYGQDRDLKEALEHQVVLTTYAIVRNDVQELEKANFEYIILDEVQAIKNTSSHSSKAAMLLNGKHRFALSGTPMENNLTELYSNPKRRQYGLRERT